MRDKDSLHPCIYEDDNLSMYIEMLGNEPFIHVSVYNWNHKLFKEWVIIFQEIKETFMRKGYTRIFASDMNKKTTKFAKMFGFKDTPLKTIGTDGKLRRVLVCQQQ